MIHDSISVAQKEDRKNNPNPSDQYFLVTEFSILPNELIQESYSMNWLIDGLPASRARIDPQTGEKFNSVGFELGSLDEAGEPVLNNHYDIFVDFHVLTNNPKRVFFFPPLLMVDGWERSISGCWSCCTTIE